MRSKYKAKLINNQLSENKTNQKEETSNSKEEKDKISTNNPSETLTHKKNFLSIDTSNILDSKSNTINKKYSLYTSYHKKNKSVIKTEFSDTIMSFSDTFKNNYKDQINYIILIQSFFRGYLLRTKKKLLIFKTPILKPVKNGSSIYKRKTPVKYKEYNTSKNYNTFSANAEKRFFKYRDMFSDSNSKKNIKDISYIKKNKPENQLVTKNYVINKKKEIAKINLIQTYWKKKYNKIKIESKMKSIIKDYKKNNININNSFMFMSQIRPYSKNYKNNFHSFNTENDIIIENEEENENLNSITDYNHNCDTNYLNSFIRTNSLIKKNNKSLNLNDCQTFKSNSYKKKNNFRSFLLNSVTSNFRNYNIECPNVFFKKHAINLNKTPNTKRSARIGENYDIKIVNNNINIWKKAEIKIKINKDDIFKFKDMIPNKNFILVETRKKEKKIFLNNKQIINKPNVNKLKKIKNRIKKTNSCTRRKSFGLANLKGSLNENSKNSLSIKRTTTDKKKKNKQNIINNYFVNEIDFNEPSLILERKLTMEKPYIGKNKKRKKTQDKII